MPLCRTRSALQFVATGGSDNHGGRKYNRLSEAGLEWE